MNIYVGNLNFTIEENELETLFDQYGKVDSVKIIRDQDSGRSKGFAFVDMPEHEEAILAIKELNLIEIKGRNIKVNKGNKN